LRVTCDAQFSKLAYIIICCCCHRTPDEFIYNTFLFVSLSFVPNLIPSWIRITCNSHLILCVAKQTYQPIPAVIMTHTKIGCVSEMCFVKSHFFSIRHVCGLTLSMRQAIISLFHFGLWLDIFGSLGLYRGMPTSLLS